MTGKSYELISFQAQEPDAAVFLSSGTESKVGTYSWELILRQMSYDYQSTFQKNFRWPYVCAFFEVFISIQCKHWININTSVFVATFWHTNVLSVRLLHYISMTLLKNVKQALFSKCLRYHRTVFLYFYIQHSSSRLGSLETF